MFVMALLCVCVGSSSPERHNLGNDGQRLLDFSLYTAERLNEKFNTGGRFQDFKNAFSNVKYDHYKQEGRLAAITSVEQVLDKLTSLVKDMTRKAEESFYVTPPDPNVTFYDGDLVHNVVRGDEAFMGRKDPLLLSEKEDPRFGIRINPAASVVRVAVDMFKGDSRVKHDVKVTARLEQLYRKNFNITKDFFFQHFGTPNGVTRIYPAHHIPEFKYTFKGTREYYDGRDRVWYIEGTSPPKDILFMVDFSGSMSGLAQSIAKNLLKILFNHIPTYDYINIIAINKDPFLPSGCFNSTLEKASQEVKDNLLNSIEKVDNFGRSNFSKAFDLAFDVLERSDGVRKTNGCSKTLVIICDGDVGQIKEMQKVKELFAQRNKNFTDMPVKVIVFRTITTMERNGISDLSQTAQNGVVSFACDNAQGEYVRLMENSAIYDALINFTDFFVPDSDAYNPNSLISEVVPKWTHVYNSFTSNLGPTATLVHPVVVAADYNYYQYHTRGQEYTARRIKELEQERVKRSPGSTTRLLGVAGVDFPIFKTFGKDNILSNLARVITMKGEYLIIHPEIQGGARQFEFQQLERGPDLYKIRQVQDSHAHGQEKFLRLPVFLAPKEGPVGGDILVETFYKVKSIRNTPFTVGLSLPIRLDYQYVFDTVSEVDEGRVALEACEGNIIFRSLKSSKCASVLAFLADEDNKRMLGEMILSRLQDLASSDAIPDELLCLYDLYLPSLMEGFALKEILTDWNSLSNQDGPKIFFHSSSGNIYLTPRREGVSGEIADLREEPMFLKMTSSDPVDVLYVSLASPPLGGELHFNISKRVPLKVNGNEQPNELLYKVAGMLSYRVSNSTLKNTLLGVKLSKALNSPEKAMYALDERGFVVFVLTQEEYKIKLKTISQFLESVGSTLLAPGDNSPVFFGRVQPLMMQALASHGLYKHHTIDRCHEVCNEEVYNMGAVTDSSPLLSNLLLAVWLFVQQTIFNVMTSSLLAVSWWGPAAQADIKHFPTSREYDGCCSAHNLYRRDFDYTSSGSFSFDCKYKKNNSCTSRSVLVQPVNGTNLVLVLDHDKGGDCASLNTSSPCPGLAHINPLSNQDPTLRSSLGVCNFDYTITDRSRTVVPHVCFQKDYHDCSRGNPRTFSSLTIILATWVVGYVRTV